MFAGMKRLFKGNKVEAVRHFQDCVAQKQTNYIDSYIAQAELEQLNQ